MSSYKDLLYSEVKKYINKKIQNNIGVFLIYSLEELTYDYFTFEDENGICNDVQIHMSDLIYVISKELKNFTIKFECMPGSYRQKLFSHDFYLIVTILD